MHRAGHLQEAERNDAARREIQQQMAAVERLRGDELAYSNLPRLQYNGDSSSAGPRYTTTEMLTLPIFLTEYPLPNVPDGLGLRHTGLKVGNTYYDIQGEGITGIGKKNNLLSGKRPRNKNVKETPIGRITKGVFEGIAEKWLAAHPTYDLGDSNCQQFTIDAAKEAGIDVKFNNQGALLAAASRYWNAVAGDDNATPEEQTIASRTEVPNGQIEKQRGSILGLKTKYEIEDFTQLVPQILANAALNSIGLPSDISRPLTMFAYYLMQQSQRESEEAKKIADAVTIPENIGKPIEEIQFEAQSKSHVDPKDREEFAAKANRKRKIEAAHKAIQEANEALAEETRTEREDTSVWKFINLLRPGI